MESASGLLEWPVDSFGLALDFGVLVAVTTVMVIIAGRLYPNEVTRGLRQKLRSEPSKQSRTLRPVRTPLAPNDHESQVWW